MPDPTVTSSEQLDALLAAGKISQTEYETLRGAMEARDAEEARRRRQEKPARLSKSWKNRQIGGVCAGLAEYFGYETWKVRLIALLALLLSGGSILLVYFALWILLPWSEGAEPTATGKAGGFPWAFACLLGLLFVAHVGFLTKVVPHFTAIFRDMGVALPAGTLLVIQLSQGFGMQPWGLLFQLLLATLLLGSYLLLPPGRIGRKILPWVVVGCFALLSSFYAVAIYMPLRHLTTALPARATAAPPATPEAGEQR